MKSLVLPIIISIACCYVRGDVALLRYSYHDNLGNETLGEETFLWRECHVDPDEDDAGGVEMTRCWRKLGNYIDWGSLREGWVLSKRKRSAMIC